MRFGEDFIVNQVVVREGCLIEVGSLDGQICEYEVGSIRVEERELAGFWYFDCSFAVVQHENIGEVVMEFSNASIAGVVQIKVVPIIEYV